MPDKYKLLEKIRSGPRNVRASQLRKLMKSWEFSFKEIDHGVIYYHPLTEFVSVAEHRESGQENKILVKYVKRCLSAIDKLILLEGDNHEGH